MSLTRTSSFMLVRLATRANSFLRKRAFKNRFTCPGLPFSPSVMSGAACAHKARDSARLAGISPILSLTAPYPNTAYRFRCRCSSQAFRQSANGSSRSPCWQNRSTLYVSVSAGETREAIRHLDERLPRWPMRPGLGHGARSRRNLDYKERRISFSHFTSPPRGPRNGAKKHVSFPLSALTDGEPNFAGPLHRRSTLELFVQPWRKSVLSQRLAATDRYEYSANPSQRRGRPRDDLRGRPVFFQRRRKWLKRSGVSLCFDPVALQTQGTARRFRSPRGPALPMAPAQGP